MERGGLVRVGEIQNPLRPTYHDFGEVEAGTPLEHTFSFENREGRPVDVLRVRGSCDCTMTGLRAVLPDGSVVQGDPRGAAPCLTVPIDATVEFTVRVDPNAVRQANRDKLVTIRATTDSERTPYLPIEVHLVVVEHFQVAPDVVDFGRVARSSGPVTEATVTRLGTTFHSLGEILETPSGVVASVGPHPTAPDGTWLVGVRVETGLPESAITGSVKVATTDQDGRPAQPIEIPVRGLIVPDIGLDPPIVSLRPMDGGIGHAVRVVARDRGRRFAVLETRIAGGLADRLTVEATPEGPDTEGRAGSWNIRVQGAPLADGEALTSGAVVITLDDPETPRIEVPISTVALR